MKVEELIKQLTKIKTKDADVFYSNGKKMSVNSVIVKHSMTTDKVEVILTEMKQ